MTVSVIVPTKNAARTLTNCLESLVAQHHVIKEMIVVDNYSGDGTPQIAERYGALLVRHGPERAFQKNAGVRAATGDYIVFIDADMELSAGVIAACLGVAGRGVAVIIPEESFGANFWARAKVLERRCYRGNDAIEAARFFHREDFLALGGFDEDLVASGEDLDLSQRARRSGFEFRRVEPLIMHDEGSPTPWETFIKWRYYGRNMAKYWARNPVEARAQYNPLRRGWLRHWRALVSAPHLTAAFLFLKVCQLAGVMLGVVDSRLGRADRQGDPHAYRVHP
jgi:glycosyltransferase involved in cell wall biosynthesis